MINLEKAEETTVNAPATRKYESLLWAAFALFIACYVAKDLLAAARTPVWLDEVLSIWVIKMNSVHEMLSAIYRGSEFVPPTYNLFLHYYSQVMGSSYLALRLPSITAVFIFAYCSFVLVRRYLGLAAALFACCLILEDVRFYSLQIRPYAACIALFGVALVLWDGLERSGSRWRLIAMFVMLAGADSIHFYSVFFIPTIGLVEILRWARTRQFRLPVWITLFLSGAAIFVWLPLIRAFSKYNGADVNSPLFYGRPTVARLFSSYYDLLCMNHVVPTVILATAALIALFRYWGERDANNELTTSRDSNFWALVLGVSLLPAVTWVFSYVITKNYNDRYLVAGCFGVIALITGLVSTIPAFRRTVPFMLVLAGVLTWTHSLAAWGSFEREPVFKRLAGDNLPIVLADAQQFFTLEESSPAYIHSRLFYVALPPDTPLPDPTVVHQLMRWKAINPKLPVEDMDTFLKSHSDFYVLDTHAGTDDTPLDYMLQRGLIEMKQRFPDGSLLFQSKPVIQKP